MGDPNGPPVCKSVFPLTLAWFPIPARFVGHAQEVKTETAPSGQTVPKHVKKRVPHYSWHTKVKTTRVDVER